MNDAATGCCKLAACLACACASEPKAVRAVKFHGELCLLDDGPSMYRVEQLDGREFYCVLGGNVVILPCNGMRTDLGSIPRLAQLVVPDDSYNPGFVPHDAMYYYRYALQGRRPALCESDHRALRVAAHIHDEDERLHVLSRSFDLLPIKTRHWADAWLDAMIAELNGGWFHRLIIRTGLLLGSWGPWYHGKYAARLDYMQRHALKFPIRVLEGVQ